MTNPLKTRIFCHACDSELFVQSYEEEGTEINKLFVNPCRECLRNATDDFGKDIDQIGVCG